MIEEMYLKAKNYVYRNARPLEVCLWKFFFEEGNKNDVIESLAYFQNEDGGFGNGLEPDCLNPNSSPIQTQFAMEVLRKINFVDKSHPMIKKILNYLESGSGFDNKHNQWCLTIPTNNDYPHAIWWEDKKEKEFSYNPTAYIAGFIIFFAEESSPLYKKGEEIIKEAYNYVMKNNIDSTSYISFLQMYYYLISANKINIIDLPSLRIRLINLAEKVICTDSSKWHKEYVLKPSDFIVNSQSVFAIRFHHLIKKEVKLMPLVQEPNGSFPITWEWHNSYQEFAIAKRDWKSVMIINNLCFYNEFGNMGEKCLL